MTLALRYRPKKFSEFVGSESTAKALISKLRSNDTPHAFLLTGPSGCGKTTLARLIAKYLRARDNNFIEMDSASFRGIDTIREVRRQMHLAPIGKSKSRVWLLDECHQLSKDAQEALLKALEDTPSHVYFILATTDPQKLKITLKRRCSHYEVEPVDDDELDGYLHFIAAQEEKDVSDGTIDTIIDQSQGSIGIALSLLDAVIDLPLDDQAEAAESKAAELKASIDLCRALIKGSNWKTVAGILKGIKEAKEDPERVRRAALGYCTSILLNGKKDDKAFLIMDCFQKPFFDSPFQQLVLACYEVVEG